MSETIGIWFPFYFAVDALPAFYVGSPSDIVVEIARDFVEEDLDLDDAVEFLWGDLGDYLDAEIEFPEDMSVSMMAEGLIAVMLDFGLAREMPEA